MSSETPKDATTAIGYFWKAREMLTPTLKKTAFLTKGVLTPEEFVQAGDELVYRCPTWSWQSGDKPYLPPDKQYLITRNVPCQDRVATLEVLPIQDLAEGDGDDDWMLSSMPKQQQNIEDDFDVIDEEGEVVEQQKQDVEIEEYADMADFEDENVLQDGDAVADTDHILKVRTYDLTLTYDKYYQTPRIWMTGKSATGQPLTAKETMEDVMTDYANKTVTMEAHPFLPGPHASIHPCKHGRVMKTIVRNLIDSSKDNQEPSVELYLFIFLKFVSSIIPTINYDFTMGVTADTSK